MYRKYQAAEIFDGRQMLGPGQVLVCREDGQVEDIVPLADAGEGIQQFNGILSPGLINCHCHLELSHMKGRVPEGTGLVDFVVRVVTERHHPEEEILQAIADAEEEMWRNGIVAVGDICNNAFTLPQKTKKRLHYYNFIEASGWLPSVAQQRLQRAQELMQLFANDFPHHTSIVPHASYSVSPALWKAMQPHFGGKVVTIHNQETVCEDEFFEKGTGDFNRMYALMNIDCTHHQPTNKSSLQSYFSHLKQAESILLVHNTFTEEDDVAYVQSDSGNGYVSFCICINANLYIESALPPVMMMRDKNCNLVLGTDSLASNRSLSIAGEIMSLRSNFPAISLEEMLRWATLNGARALGMDERLGSFEKGKIPGIVHFDENLSFIERLL